MPRGGKREGAGRPMGTGRYGEPTVSRRIPMSMAAEVDALLQAAKPKARTPKPSDVERVTAALRVPDAGYVQVLPRCSASAMLGAMAASGVHAQAAVIDPWYREKSAPGRAAYLAEMIPIIELTSRVADHIFIWGFAEALARLVDHWPQSLTLKAWLTWSFKNAPTRARNWRPSQQACLHLCRKGAKVYPEHFYSESHKQAAAANRLEYKPVPYSVIEAPLLSGFIDRTQQRGFKWQKPRRVIEPLIRMTCRPEDLVIDPYCGSGTTGEVAARYGARAILSDRNAEALRITRKRLDEGGLLASTCES